MKGYLTKAFPLLMIVVTVFSVQQLPNIPISTTFISWAINFFIIYIILKFKVMYANILSSSYIEKNVWLLVNIYILWLLLNSIRGAFIAENYWEYKQLITGIQSLLLPLFIYVFAVPKINSYILRYWFKYALIIFVLLLPFLSTKTYQFYLAPVFLAGCFIPILPKKWKIILGILLITMLFVDWGARSQVIKSAVALMVAIGIYFKMLIPQKLFKIVHWACYIIPIILLALGISGQFNIFEDLSSNEGKYIEKSVVNGKQVEEDLSADTRTFIYVEVIESALKHNYVIWGRTPARGNDSMTFGIYQAEQLKTGKYERHSNEVCHTNVFTWLGLIGVILYSLIYLRSSYLAVYRSKNIYIKFIGCFIAFRWAYGWVEDGNTFSILSISLWIMIAMGISTRFRLMTNEQFQSWIYEIFGNRSKKYIVRQTPYSNHFN